MKKETLKNIFNFIEENERHQTPFLWKWVNNIPLTEKDLNVKGDLVLEFSKKTSLPEGLEVGGTLDLTYSKIVTLPKGLKVGGNLYIFRSPLKEYTGDELREMIKPGFIKGIIFG
jgi:hypothetical protein